MIFPHLVHEDKLIADSHKVEKNEEEELTLRRE